MAPHIYVLHNKKQTPFNLIGSMMIIRVLPIHVPPCYEGGYLKPRHWKHIWLMMIIWSDPSMFHDAVSPWSLHIYHYEAMQGQGPHFPPTRKATIHIHRGEGGKGVKMGTLHWGGVGGGLAKPGSYIYIPTLVCIHSHTCISPDIQAPSEKVFGSFWIPKIYLKHHLRRYLAV